MPITEEQLNTIKAANHAKSVAWEAATFRPGDEVISHGFGVWRTEDGKWLCRHDLIYETLSRFGRDRLKRNTFNPKTTTFLKVSADTFIESGMLPPAAERSQWAPWTPGRPWYTERLRPQPERQEQPQQRTLEERVANLEERILAVGAAVALIATRLNA